LLHAILVLGLVALPAAAQDSKKEIQKYRQMVAEGSPAELFEVAGEELWKKPQGPNNVSLEKCDLGLGPGVLKGAYARLPRYFKDADRVMDLETRLLHCMVTLQGRTREEATQRVFGNADRPSDMESLSAYVAGQSRGMKMAPGTSHPKEKAAYELGKALYVQRAGPWDFACTSCHGESGKRIRMQELPGAAQARVRARRGRQLACIPRLDQPASSPCSGAMNNCYQQMRYARAGLRLGGHRRADQFLTVTGKGEPYRGPGNKR
jgi:sulfur-oxidizing protein SoxA